MNQDTNQSVDPVDLNDQEMEEWLDAMDSLVRHGGKEASDTGVLGYGPPALSGRH